MPSGVPPGTRLPPAPAGTDWLVVVPKWTLLVAFPAACVGWLLWASGVGSAAAWTIAAAGAVLASVFALSLAYAEGGWARLRRADRQPEKRATLDDRVRTLASRSVGYRALVLAGSLAALAGAVCFLVIPRKPQGVLAAKLAVAGATGHFLSWKSLRRRDPPSSGGSVTAP